MCTDIAILQSGQLVIAGSVEQVTHQLGGGRQLEIRILRPEDVAATIALLEADPSISAVRHDLDKSGVLIQAACTGDDHAMHQILSTLINNQIPVVSFSPRSGGGRLEEVFLNITERGDEA
jgi:ABC-type multidrug transport system ATPase subunit